jgi:hypothetical protein
MSEYEFYKEHKGKLKSKILKEYYDVYCENLKLTETPRKQAAYIEKLHGEIATIRKAIEDGVRRLQKEIANV